MANNNYILGTVGTAEGFINGQRVLNSKTLLNSSISLSTNPTEIRGGENNALIGTLYFDPSMSMTLDDATFSLEYLALKTGSTISAGSTDWATEQITITRANEITVTGTPVPFGNLGKIGFYRVIGGDGEEKQIVFDGQVASASGLEVGDKVCVKYNKTMANAREIKIASNFVPSELYLLVHAPLFLASQSNTANSQKVGEIAIEIPRFLVNPSGDLNLTSNGVATVPLSGSAQKTDNDITSCDSTSYYGKIKEIIWNKDILDDATNIVVADSDIELDSADSETETLRVMALFDGMTMPKQLDNSELTFASSSQAIATVVDGVVTAVSNGTATITVGVNGHPNLVAKAVVTVS